MKSVFPKRLREVRELRKLSQSELAQCSGLKPSAISHFETGRRSPSMANLYRLSSSLSISADYLIGIIDVHDVAVGPLAERITLTLGKLNANDQGNLAIFAEMLLNKKYTQAGCTGD